MQYQTPSTEELINQHFNNPNQSDSLRAETMSSIVKELSVTQTFVSNKDIIRSLLIKLETERDVARKDALRQALETLMQPASADNVI